MGQLVTHSDEPLQGVIGERLRGTGGSQVRTEGHCALVRRRHQLTQRPQPQPEDHRFRVAQELERLALEFGDALIRRLHGGSKQVCEPEADQVAQQGFHGCGQHLLPRGRVLLPAKASVSKRDRRWITDDNGQR